MQSPAWHAEIVDAPRTSTIPATAAPGPQSFPQSFWSSVCRGVSAPTPWSIGFLKKCEVLNAPDEKLARRAGALRARAGRGSAVDAVVVAMAEPGGAVLTHDAADLRALAAHARDVTIFAA